MMRVWMGGGEGGRVWREGCSLTGSHPKCRMADLRCMLDDPQVETSMGAALRKLSLRESSRSPVVKRYPCATETTCLVMGRDPRSLYIELPARRRRDAIDFPDN